MSVMFWPSIFLAIGLLLIVLEVFIPSGGLIGFCSIACLVLCLWYAFAESFGLGAMFVLIDLIALPLTATLALSLWSRTPLGRKFFLRPPAPEEIDVSHADSHLEAVVGEVGRTITPLRPCGYIEIAGRRAEAMAEEGFLSAAVPVRVLCARSGHLVVRGLDDHHPETLQPRAHAQEPTQPQPGPSPIDTTAMAVSILEDAL